MGMFRRQGGGGVAGHQRTVPIVVVFFLVAYLFGMHLVRSYRGFCEDHVTEVTKPIIATADLDRRSVVHEVVSTTERQKGCDTVEDYIEDGDYENGVENAWRQLKWGLPPAKCRVNGHLIERLDPVYNYRRGVALGFTTDIDDRAPVEHWFLGTKVDFNLRKRRVFIDLGANYFETSVVWFNTRYPCDFTEVYAFEVVRKLFSLPQGFDEESNFMDPPVINESNFMMEQPGIKKIKARNGYLPQWMIDRIHPYYKFAGDVDDELNNAVNITRFIKDELKLTEHDAVIVKMDIEGSEWPILRRWLKDPDMPKIIDELWVEVHYFHPDNNLRMFTEWNRDQATRILAEMRFKGFYVHYWG